MSVGSEFRSYANQNRVTSKSQRFIVYVFMGGVRNKSFLSISDNFFSHLFLFFFWGCSQDTCKTTVIDNVISLLQTTKR